MKHYIYNALAACGCIAAFTACDENSWNENELKGFEVPEVTDVKTVEYTLTDADYATIASNSTNKTLAGDNQAALKAVGTKFCFNEEIPAKDYVPAFLASTSFPYFTLDNGSYVKLTYRTSVALPEEIAAIEAGQQYTVSDNNYQEVWGSENDYIPAFAPSHKPASEIPAILAAEYPDAVAGEYVLVTYKEAATDPVFNAPEEPEKPGFTMSNVISALKLNDDCTINGVVTALCTQGFMLADESGTIFVYGGGTFGTNGFGNLKVGDQIVLDGTVGAYNKGFQIANGATWEVQGNQEVTYPAATTLDATKLAEVIARTDNALAIYGTMTGKVSITEGKNGVLNYNLIVADSEKAQGSFYGITDEIKNVIADGADVTINGYLVNIASGKFCNMVVTSVKANNAATTTSLSRAAEVASVSKTGLYTFNGSKWVAASNAVALGHEDYQAMGQRYDNLSGEAPEQFLPVFLKQTFPYAVAEDTKFVTYLYFVSGAGTSIRCDQYIYNGSEWTLNSGIVTETSQFVKTQGKWMYDPNVTITLPAGKGIEISTLYYQTCVDWVKDNIDKPTGATYVTSYGNNEYYSGTSAYQGNVDLRASSARAQYPAGYEGMTDAQIVDAMKSRFEKETMPAALAKLHADADLIPGVDVLYTINFSAYNGSTTTAYTIVYKLVAKGKFEFVECDW